MAGTHHYQQAQELHRTMKLQNTLEGVHCARTSGQPTARREDKTTCTEASSVVESSSENRFTEAETDFNLFSMISPVDLDFAFTVLATPQNIESSTRLISSLTKHIFG
jgi:hypothetical protein